MAKYRAISVACNVEISFAIVSNTVMFSFTSTTWLFSVASSVDTKVLIANIANGINRKNQFVFTKVNGIGLSEYSILTFVFDGSNK